MKVYTAIDQLPVFTRSVITIGTFDGVHLGHKKILKQLTELAENIDGDSVLITFYPHPKKIVQQDRSPLMLINTQEEKLKLLADEGIAHVVVVPFSIEFAEQDPQTYVEDFLVKKFNPHTIIIGYDHRFGKDRQGDYHMLENAGEAFNFQVKEIEEKLLKDVTISSTKIRNALLGGDVKTAAAYLGYNYFFTGKVEEGAKLGRTINFPTANISIADDDKLIPANGVYAVTAKTNNNEALLKGMMNIGVRPTVDGNFRKIEVHLFDFNEDIYGHDITISIQGRIRNEIKFPSLADLQHQLGQDKQSAMELLKEITA